MRELINFIKTIYSYKSMIFAMAIRDIKARYVGTIGGMIWSIINPLVIIFVYWFVFSVGFKVQFERGVPFIVVFLGGFIPWSMFAEGLMLSTSSVTSNKYLIKKIHFPSEVLPVVSLVSSVITHGVMLFIYILVLIFNHISISLYVLQLWYYLFALSILVIGLGWLLASLNVFFKDIVQILTVSLNLWFWLTPIVWAINIVPERFRFFVKLNPLYYIIEGYRNSLIYEIPFWCDIKMGLYYWGFTILFFLIGINVFKRLKQDFVEVM